MSVTMYKSVTRNCAARAGESEQERHPDNSAPGSAPSAPSPGDPVPRCAHTPPASPRRHPKTDGAADLAEKLACMHVAESAVASQDGERCHGLGPGLGEAQTSEPVSPAELHGAVGETATGWFPVLEFLQPALPPELVSTHLAWAPCGVDCPAAALCRAGRPTLRSLTFSVPRFKADPSSAPLLPLPDGLALVVPAAALGPREAVHASPHAMHAMYPGPRVIATPQQMALLMSRVPMAGADHSGLGPRLLTPTKFRRRLREVATQTSAGLRRRGAGGVSSGANRSRYGDSGLTPQ